MSIGDGMVRLTAFEGGVVWLRCGLVRKVWEHLGGSRIELDDGEELLVVEPHDAVVRGIGIAVGWIVDPYRHSVPVANGNGEP